MSPAWRPTARHDGRTTLLPPAFWTEVALLFDQPCIFNAPCGAMSGVAFLAPAPPRRSPAGCQRCVPGWRGRGAAACPRTPPELAGRGWVVRLPGQALVTRAAVLPFSGRWHMTAGPSGGGRDAEADDGVEVDMELLRKRIKEVQSEGEGSDEDEDAEDVAFVVEVSVDEVHVPVNDDEDNAVVLELVSSDDSDSDSDSDDSGDSGDVDDAVQSQGAGPPVMGQLRSPNWSENKEIALAYRDCSSLYIILFNAEGEGEGLYSIQVGDQNVVLAFARVEEAGRYARALKDQRIIDVESIVDIQVAVRGLSGVVRGLTRSIAVGLARPFIFVHLVRRCAVADLLPALANSGLVALISLSAFLLMAAVGTWYLPHRSWNPWVSPCLHPPRVALAPSVPQELVPAELEEFCSDAGVRLGFVPADALLSPEHLHTSNDATFSPFSSSPPDPLRDGGMAEGEADALREKLNKLLGKDGGDA